ncbi:MAG: 3-oxoacyl-ACP reductase FabG [Actinomycetota bacterium]|nr:3-oxoacyl-ACP reductase FabG [Actinomycetota bacterium]
MGKLEGTVAVVTGAGRGIGRAVAEELGASGTRVVVNYSNSKGPAEEVVASLSQNGSENAVAVQADVSDPEQAARLIEETIERFGRIDILVNNAGITIDKTMKKLTTEEWDKVVQVDLNSCYYTVKAALPHFTEQQSGTVINMSSFVGEAGNFGQTNYAAAKAGLIGFTKSAALELARYNVTVNAICPGFIETDMFGAVPENVKDRIRARIPLGRIGEPTDIARTVRFLAEDGGYITGQTISVNGGVYM